MLSSQDQPAHTLFPWVHISLSNLKRFPLGTHHQAPGREFNYRLNRRTMEPNLLPRLPRACHETQTITFQ